MSDNIALRQPDRALCGGKVSFTRNVESDAQGRGNESAKQIREDTINPWIAFGQFGFRRVVANAKVAEREGFEPPGPFGPTVFKTAAFDHSATSPGVGEDTENRREPRKPGSRSYGQVTGFQRIGDCPSCHIKLL